MSLFIAILTPLVAAGVAPFLFRWLPRIHTGWFILPFPFALFLFFLQYIPPTMDGRPTEQVVPWVPSLGVDLHFYLDGLSLLFALLITGIGTLIVLYSISYLDKQTERLNHFYVYLCLFMTAMLGVVLSDNLIVLYLFWELTSLSSFFLIGYWNHRERSRYGALKSLLITVGGGFAMLAGFVLLSQVTGSFSLRESMAQFTAVQQSPLYLPIVLLILAGAFSKSAQFPFHVWLPDAMEAPTPVSAYLHSATMVKAGIYLVARFTPLLGETSLWFWLVSGVGIATLFWGSLLAVKQTDLKAILAYSTVSQLGLIMALLGYGIEVALLAAMFHLLNHATFKGSLFMAAGIVEHETGTREIARLGGLAKIMPILAAIAFLGTFSMAGVPPFNGFLSKEMFLNTSLRLENLEWAGIASVWWLFPLLAVVGSIFTFVYSMMLFFRTFAGERARGPLPKKPHEASFLFLLPPILLVSLVLVIAFYPTLLEGTLLAPAVEAMVGSPQEVHIAFWHGFDLTLALTLTIFVVGTALVLLLPHWTKAYGKTPSWLHLNTWYDGGLASLERGARLLALKPMSGILNHYLSYIFLAIITLTLWTLLSSGSFAFRWDDLAGVNLYEVLLLIVMICAAGAVPFMTSRIAGMIALGAVGYTVSLFFVIFRAPDLALTQLIVETVSVVLFLLGFAHLPFLGKNPQGKVTDHQERSKKGKQRLNLLISIGAGAVVSLVAFSAYSTRMFDSIAHYYVENSHDLAGGNNIVNVILVDFRGLDTLFEILVLGIAALGIFSLAYLSREGRGTR